MSAKHDPEHEAMMASEEAEDVYEPQLGRISDDIAREYEDYAQHWDAFHQDVAAQVVRVAKHRRWQDIRGKKSLWRRAKILGCACDGR